MSNIKRDTYLREIREFKKSGNVKDNDETFVDYNPKDVLPDVIDKDYGFFLMFGNPDIPLENTASNNLDSEVSLSGLQK